jgi:hypothetical protein
MQCGRRSRCRRPRSRITSSPYQIYDEKPVSHTQRTINDRTQSIKYVKRASSTAERRDFLELYVLRKTKKSK